MQVASTLWSRRKSQKISEYRFRLKWTKRSPRTEAKQVKTGQPQRGLDKEAQTSPTPSSWGWLAARAGRPADANQAHGPHRLNFSTWRLPVAPLGRFGVLRPVAPSYKYKGGYIIEHTHTHTHTHLFLSCFPCIVFRLSGV